MHLLWLFFGWPQGAVWGNVWAIPLCAVVGGTGAFIFRDRIGHAIAAWWHRHHGPHLRAELDAMEQRLAEQARAHHTALKAYITAEAGTGTPPAARRPKPPKPNASSERMARP